jgi:hypothetical protein
VPVSCSVIQAGNGQVYVLQYVASLSLWWCGADYQKKDDGLSGGRLYGDSIYPYLFLQAITFSSFSTLLTMTWRLAVASKRNANQRQQQRYMNQKAFSWRERLEPAYVFLNIVLYSALPLNGYSQTMLPLLSARSIVIGGLGLGSLGVTCGIRYYLYDIVRDIGGLVNMASQSDYWKY